MMWKSFFKTLINLYFCLLVYVAFSVGVATEYGGATAYPSESKTYSVVSYVLSVYLYVVLRFFPVYLLIPAIYQVTVYHFKIQSLRALIIIAGITGGLGALILLALNWMKSNYWLLDSTGLGITGLLYGLIDGLWVRKKAEIGKVRV